MWRTTRTFLPLTRELVDCGAVGVLPAKPMCTVTSGNVSPTLILGSPRLMVELVCAIGVRCKEQPASLSRRAAVPRFVVPSSSAPPMAIISTGGWGKMWLI